MTLSTNIVANPAAEVISELLKIQNLENELSSLWTREQMSATLGQAKEVQKEATQTKKAAKKAADQLLDEAYGLFGAAATQIGMGVAIIGIGGRSKAQSRALKKGMENDRTFLEGLKNPPAKDVAAGNTSPKPLSEETRAKQETLINAEWKEGEVYDPEKHGEATSQLYEKELSKAKENTRDRIKNKESQMLRLNQNHQDATTVLNLLGQSTQQSVQGGMKIPEAEHKAEEGKKEAKKLLHQQNASIQQAAQQTADKGEQAFTKGAQEMPQLLSEIENANLFRA